MESPQSSHDVECCFIMVALIGERKNSHGTGITDQFGNIRPVPQPAIWCETLLPTTAFFHLFFVLATGRHYWAISVGTIPVSLLQLKKLRELKLYRNRIAGG